MKSYQNPCSLQANQYESYNELELVDSLKKQEIPSFNYLYDNYCNVLYGIVLSIIPDPEAANDVLQEVFINIWRNIDSYAPHKSKLFTWMATIARNSSINVLRSKSYRKSKKNISLSDDRVLDKSLKSLDLNVDGIGLKMAVANLKPEFKILIDLAYFNGYTHEGIAEIINIPLGTVKTRIRSALTQLRSDFSR